MNDDQNDEADEITDQIESINNRISQMCADKNKKTVEDFLEHASDGIDGFGHQKVWKTPLRAHPLRRTLREI